MELAAGARGRPSGPVAPRSSARALERRQARPVVLLVDDLADQRELYRQYLEFAGYEVAVARDGFEAVDQALSVHPDVIIMDLAMPGLDGFETTQRLRGLEATRAIPVIALTAHGELPREWALAAGCAAYLKKPCYPHDLGMEISAVLDKGSASRPEPAAFRPLSEHPHVLVVDGNVGDRELFAEYLEYRGCLVSVSLSMTSALADAQKRRPQVIVLDLDVPRLAGWEVLRSLRRDPVTRDIPVVGLTRQPTDARREDARNLGAVVLSKPCEPDALFLAVSKAAAAPRERG
ncbi:MAG TPA: response regulator [Vicinamibacteria bacterium]|nr:response regulator [Vicinamibacteria bacterium]